MIWSSDAHPALRGLTIFSGKQKLAGVTNRQENSMQRNLRVGLSLACLLAAVSLYAADDGVDWKKLYEEQRQRNNDLERRLSLLEQRSTQDVYVVKEKVPEGTLKFLQQTELSGYVAGSYFYNFNRPATDVNTGRGFDWRADEFSANKVVLTLQKSVEYNAFDWTAGYAAQLIYGQDAEFTQSGGLSLGPDGDLFLANVTVNVPIGNGLKVTVGKYGTMLGYELSLTEQNANWSAGNQWTFIEPFTHTGVILAYKPTDELEVQFLLNNGWDLVADNNAGKSFMLYVNYAPNDNTSFTAIGYGGPEQAGTTANWRRGAELIASHKWTHKFNTVLQLDYGIEDGLAASGGPAEWYAAGLWLTYDFNPKWQVAFRSDWLKDAAGVRTSDVPFRNPFPTNTGQDLYSVTFTLNYKPLPEVRISPELRWDHSSLNTAFDGHPDQFTIGVGAAYFY